MRPPANFGHSGTDIYQPVWAACWLERAADLCPIHSESAYPLTTVVIDTSDDSMQVGDGRCHVRFLLYFGLIISRLGRTHIRQRTVQLATQVTGQSA
jgi:hypothetical protein